LTPAVWFAVGLGLAWLLATAFRPREAVWFIILWVPVQGWFQLNVFGDSAQTVLVYEYLLIAVYVMFFVRSLRFPQDYRPPKVWLFALPFTLWTISLIPHSLDTVGPLLTGIGLRTYLFPLPLVWIGFQAFRSRNELEGFAAIVSLEAVVVGVIAAMQFASLVTPWGAIVDLPTGYGVAGTLRPPGTFSSPGHLGMYVLATVPLTIGFLGLRTSWWRATCYKLGLAGAALALIVNSQRATVVSLGVCLPLIAILANRAKTLKTITLALAVVALGASAGLFIVGDAFSDRVRSIADDANYALGIAPFERMGSALQNPVFGGGLGSASPGTGRLDVGLVNVAESFGAAVVFQFGVPGLLFFGAMLAALWGYGYMTLRQCRNSDTATLAAAILVYELAVCLNSWTYDPLHYPPSRILFWFWAGVLLSLPHLKKSQKTHETHAQSRVWVPIARVG
jgi:hypothetical protein